MYMALALAVSRVMKIRRKRLSICPRQGGLAERGRVQRQGKGNHVQRRECESERV